MRLAVLTLFIPLLALGAKRVDLVTTEKSDLAPGGTVRIEHSTGELNVEGWDEPSVQIEVTRYTWSAKPKLESIQVTKKLEGNLLTIDTAHKRFTDAHVNYRIRVPRNTSLIIHHGTGAVTVYDVTGNIEATATIGDVTVGLPEPAQYNIDAHTKIGSVYSDFGTPEHRLFRTGETLKPGADGSGDPHHLNLRVGTGSVTILKEAKATS